MSFQKSAEDDRHVHLFLQKYNRDVEREEDQNELQSLYLEKAQSVQRRGNSGASWDPSAQKDFELAEGSGPILMGLS